MKEKSLFGKRPAFLFKQTNKEVKEGDVLKVINKRGNVQFEKLEVKNLINNVAAIADPENATAEECANKINELIQKLISSGLMKQS